MRQLRAGIASAVAVIALVASSAAHAGQAAAVVTPPSLDFGLQGVNGASPAQMITITSSGTAPLVISSVSVAGPFSIAAVSLPITIATGSSATIAVSFAPTTLGPATGSVSITHNAPGSPSTVSLQGSGANPEMTLMPTTYDFGATDVGISSTPTVVTIGNTGQSTLEITAANAIGPFVISGLLLPLSVPVGGSATFDVSFLPTQTDTAVGGVQIVCNDARSPIMLALSGTGVSAGLNAIPNPLDFGNRLIGAPSMQTLQLLNNTASAITIMTAAFNGTNAAEFSSPNLPMAGDVIAPNSTLDVTLAFQAGDHGSRSATLTLLSDAPNGPLVVQLAGTGQGPTIQVTPPMLDLGSATVGQPVLGLASVKNTGESTLHVAQAAFGGLNAGDFSSPSSFPLAVAPGATAMVAVRFVPAAIGQRAATMTLASDDALTPSVDVALVGTGAVPQAAVTPAAIDFGSLAVNTASAPKMLSISNTGAGALTVSQIAVAGMTPAAFATGVPFLPLVVPPGGVRTLSVVFAPTSAGAQTATVTFMTDDPTSSMVSIMLSGIGVAPAASVMPSALSFATTLVGETTAAKTVTLSNQGTAPLNVLTLGLSGTAAASYALVAPPQLPLSIAAAGSQTFSVTFSPTAAGDNSASLDIGTDDVGGAGTSVTLSGTGASTFIAVSPTTLDFGGVEEPGTAMPLTVTITNTGPTSITLVDGALSGPGAASYTVSSVAGALAVGGTQTAMVTFDATAPGAAAATITFATTDANVPPAVVSLDGNGVAPRITVTPQTLDFGDGLIGTSLPARALVITNVSSDVVQLGSVTTDGPFSASADLTAMIQPGTLDTIMVGYTPVASGLANGHVSITLAGSTVPEVVVALSGTGVLAASADAGSGSMMASGCSIGAGRSSHDCGGGLILLLAGFVALPLRRRRQR